MTFEQCGCLMNVLFALERVEDNVCHWRFRHAPCQRHYSQTSNVRRHLQGMGDAEPFHATAGDLVVVVSVELDHQDDMALLNAWIRKYRDAVNMFFI